MPQGVIEREQIPNEQIGEPELARLSVFQRRFLRLQFLACQRRLRWSANPITLGVMQQREDQQEPAQTF